MFSVELVGAGAAAGGAAPPVKGLLPVVFLRSPNCPVPEEDLPPVSDPLQTKLSPSSKDGAVDVVLLALRSGLSAALLCLRDSTFPGYSGSDCMSEEALVEPAERSPVLPFSLLLPPATLLWPFPRYLITSSACPYSLTGEGPGGVLCLLRSAAPPMVRDPGSGSRGPYLSPGCDIIPPRCLGSPGREHAGRYAEYRRDVVTASGDCIPLLEAYGSPFLFVFLREFEGSPGFAMCSMSRSGHQIPECARQKTSAVPKRRTDGFDTLPS